MNKLLLIIGDAAEVLDTMYPLFRLREEGYEVLVAAPEKRMYHLVQHDKHPDWDITIESPGYRLASDIAFRDIRPEEYAGTRMHMPDYPNEGALRTGHIPTARNVPWATAVAEDGTYRSRSELEAIYQSGGLGLKDDDSVITYCRIGERSSHTWFALKHLLGIERVRNYDGSWTEWGNSVRVPIVKGDEPGELPG